MAIDPQDDKPKVYYINHISEPQANAEFKYIEAAHSRIVIVVARKDIRKDEEILAAYSPRCYSISRPVRSQLTLN